MTNNDLPQLFDWLQRPHVKEWWNDNEDTLEKVAENYSQPEAGLERWILMERSYDAERPIGYFQSYKIDDETVGIDQLIGEPDCIGRGIGTTAIREFCLLVAERLCPTIIVLDPEPANKRAIRAYEKAGFTHYKTSLNEDGKLAYMMRLNVA